MTERWRHIEGFEGYEVSDQGRVRSWKPSGPNRPPRSEPAVLAQDCAEPYRKVTLCVGDRKYTKRVHHLVLSAFECPRPPGLWALHKDGDTANNRLSNLRWGTPKENSEDRTKHGRTFFIERNPTRKLSASDVYVIRRRYDLGIQSQGGLAKSFCVTQALISKIVRREIWTHLPEIQELVA